jgi:hypothetical protein
VAECRAGAGSGQAQVDDVAGRSEGVGPHAALRLAQVRVDDAVAVVLEHVEERDPRVAAPAEDPMHVEAESDVGRVGGDQHVMELTAAEP